ncbi:transmembrane protein 131-like isoform X2 [Oncorhynchus keta]|uniref:transmembrane protein 131-like isoform X2 n=1 Tax=Oncorhynchus keta TaxID=8018 RepID=UPI00227B9B9C|nr:transmembrane protein 131-like isoform X2 [Oncorhynchus keta]
MAQAERTPSFLHLPVRGKTSCFGYLRVLFFALFHIAQANKQAFIQSDTILEVLHFGEGGLLQIEPDLHLGSYHQKSSPLQRGNSRPIRFEPPMLDFHEQPVGMPKMEKVYLHNPSAEEISLISISATTAHFHASFFQNRIIPPAGNTSFDVVFLARVVGNVENTLFINTSHHGVFTYQVFGVGIPNPYRLRPFIGARVPVNSSFSPLINIHNPHSEPLQVVEMYSSGGDLHLELPTGQQGGTHHLWEIPPFETKGVMRASFSSRDADNHTAFIRIKTNASNQDEFIILPVEVEVTSAPGIYSSIEMLDFGTLRSQDRPKQLNLHLLNSGAKDVQIMSVRATPSNDAITIDFKAVTLKAGEHRYTKVASISFDASKVQKASQSSGKITVKAKEKSYSKLEIPYLAEVLDGYLGFDHTVTLFHIRDSVLEPVVKPIHLTNTFHFAIRIHDVSLPDEAKTMFLVQNFSEPVLIPPQESRYIFSLHFQPVRPSNHIDSNILLVTNASKFHLPVRAYTGFLEPFVLPPSLQDNFLDFGVLSATDTSSILFVVVNSNPIELVIRPWLLTGESLSVELLKIERGNRTTVLTKTRELHSASASPHKTVILASGYYAAFRVTLVAKDLEGAYDGAIHITTDYQILTIPVKAVVAVGTLTSYPKHIVLPPSFPGKVVQQSLSMVSSFSQKVTLQQIHSLTEDSRFYYRRLKNNRDELEPKRKSKVAKIYFDASLQCGDHCYVGLPFVLKSESRPPGLSMQEDMWDVDVDLYQMLRRRWKALKESSGHMAEAVFEANADLQKNIETRVSAQLKWPSIMNSSQQEIEVVLENPADVPVYVQVLPLALYPNLPAVTHKLAQMFPLERLPHFTPDTMEFQVHRNHSPVVRGSAGFAEGSTTQPYVYNLMLQPEEVRSLRLKFSPVSNHTVSSLLMLRNNLTVMEFLVVQGQGSYERLKVGGKAPGPGGFLRFKMTESLLKDCTDKMKSKEPNVTLRKSFKLENTGQLEINIQSTEINGRLCEGFGFKVLNCQEFSLKPNASKEIVILFTPDFTASRVIRELKFITTGGSYFVFSLNASLPYHMLAACAAVLPRPNWELELYVIISVIMSSMFLLVIVAAYLEALGIWEPFKRRMCFETSSTSMETGRPFDLREIVRLQSDAHMNGYGGEANHNSLRGMPGSASRAASRNTRGGHNRGPTQPPIPPSQPGSKVSDSTPSSGQQASRKARSPKQPQPAPENQQHPSQAGPSAPGRNPLEGPRRHSSEDSDYVSLVETMDKDLDRPESAEEGGNQDAVYGKASAAKGKVQQTKAKAQKKKEEREKRNKGRAQGGEELREDNDDSSSTTTENSNPDIMEDNKGKKKDDTPEAHSKSKIKKPAAITKEKSQMDAKSSSLELPYVTPLENKRKSFNSKNMVVVQQALASSSTTTTITRPIPPKPRVPRVKLEDFRPSLLAKFLFNEPVVQELGNSSGSEGEKDISPPPEWDCVPLHIAHNAVDSLQQISLQTMNADPFLKRPIETPPPPSSDPFLKRPIETPPPPSSDPFLKRPIETPPSSDPFLKRPIRTPPPPSSDPFLKRTIGTPPPPSSDPFLKRTIGTPPPPSSGFSLYDSYSGMVNTATSEVGLMSTASGMKNKLTKLVSVPGQNGNPTFAAVAAGFDKSPGCSATKAAVGSRDRDVLQHLSSVESDGSDSSGLWSPVGNGRRPSLNSVNSFSAFGPSNTFNLSGVFSGMTSGRSAMEPQQSWPEFRHTTPSVWPNESLQPLQPWPIQPSSSSPATPTTSILGSSSMWGSSPPFSPSIWSTSPPSDSPLHSFSSSSASPLTDLMGSTDSGTPLPAPTKPSPTQLSPSYNPWSMWRPTFSRRSSEPWPNQSDSSTG